MKTRVGIVLAVMGLAAVPAWADAPLAEPRLEHLGIVPGVNQPLLRGIAGASLPMLSIIERMRLQSGRTRIYPVELGFGNLTVGVTRFRGGDSLTAPFYSGMGRFKAQAVGAELAVPLIGGLSFRTEGSMTRITRRLSNVSSHGARGGAIAELGTGFALAGVTLMADWVRPQMFGASAIRRWREQVGFVPPARDLFHLALTTHADRPDQGQWSVTATAVNRASPLVLPGRNFAGMDDRRIEAGYRLTF